MATEMATTEVEVPKPKGGKHDRWQQTLLPWAFARLAPAVVPVSTTDLDTVRDTCTTTQLELLVLNAVGSTTYAHEYTS